MSGRQDDIGGDQSATAKVRAAALQADDVWEFASAGLNTAHDKRLVLRHGDCGCQADSGGEGEFGKHDEGYLDDW